MEGDELCEAEEKMWVLADVYSELRGPLAGGNDGSDEDPDDGDGSNLDEGEEVL